MLCAVSVRPATLFTKGALKVRYVLPPDKKERMNKLASTHVRRRREKGRAYRAARHFGERRSPTGKGHGIRRILLVARCILHGSHGLPLFFSPSSVLFELSHCSSISSFVIIHEKKVDRHPNYDNAAECRHIHITINVSYIYMNIKIILEKS